MVGVKVALGALTALAAAWTLYQNWQAIEVPSPMRSEDIWQAKVMHVALSLVTSLERVSKAVGIPMSYNRVLYNVLINAVQTGSLSDRLSDELVKVRYDAFDGVPVKVFETVSFKSNKPRAALVYFHGSGFKWFNAELVDPTARALVRRLGIIVISVDYRLAPEHRFPAAYDDCLAATKYVLREHEQLGVDAKRILVGGDSAGGNLAAAVAGQLKKQLKMQILIYPMLQAFDFAIPSFIDNRKPFVISAADVIESWMCYGSINMEYEPVFLANQHLDHGIRMSKYSRYVHSNLIPAHLEVTNRSTVHNVHGNATVSAAVHRTLLDPRFAPLMADSLDDYPDAYIVTAQHDVLRDDGIMYGQRLIESKNVHVKLEHYRDAFHGFFHVHEGPLAMSLAKGAVEKFIQFLEFHKIVD